MQRRLPSLCRSAVPLRAVTQQHHVFCRALPLLHVPTLRYKQLAGVSANRATSVCSAARYASRHRVYSAVASAFGAATCRSDLASVAPTSESNVTASVLLPPVASSLVFASSELAVGVAFEGEWRWHTWPCSARNAAPSEAESVCVLANTGAPNTSAMICVMVPLPDAPPVAMMRLGDESPMLERWVHAKGVTLRGAMSRYTNPRGVVP